MKNHKETIIWVLIFTGIIIIPTICLLWFMEQAVSNERAAIKHKVSQIYKERVKNNNWNFQQFLTIPDHKISNTPTQNLIEYLQANSIDGSVILKDREVTYPHNKRKQEKVSIQDSIWHLEYIKKDFLNASNAYIKNLEYCKSVDDSISAFMGSARCLKKAKDTISTINTYKKIIEHFEVTDSTEQICYAIIALAQLSKKDINNTLLKKLTETNYNISSSIRQFMLKSSISIIKDINSKNNYDSLLNTLKLKYEFEKKSNLFTSEYIDTSFFKNHSPEKLYIIDSISFYYTNLAEQTIIQVIKVKHFNQWLNILTSKFNINGVTLHLTNEQGYTLAGKANKKEKPFYKCLMDNIGNEEITLEFYIDNHALYPTNLKNQQATIIWIGILSILFILITGSLALSYFLKQSKLNKLKNSFLATVTHELKTPISSCRILIDTLLDDKITEPEKVKEYYKLISQENLRLSGLIDTFLTFSRMERNKQIFEYSDYPISSIINPAIDSMSVKFNQPNCKFTYINNIEDLIITANKDSLITTITNLLDNSYKYTSNEKGITLTTDINNSNLEIKVSDNGIGIPQKEIRKIFKKFYQVNRKLNRQTEGCGLGLSIVQYIINAHNGSIKVESKENIGSTFTIRIPLKR